MPINSFICLRCGRVSYDYDMRLQPYCRHCRRSVGSLWRAIITGLILTAIGVGLAYACQAFGARTL